MKKGTWNQRCKGWKCRGEEGAEEREEKKKKGSREGGGGGGGKREGKEIEK